MTSTNSNSKTTTTTTNVVEGADEVIAYYKARVAEGFSKVACIRATSVEFSDVPSGELHKILTAAFGINPHTVRTQIQWGRAQHRGSMAMQQPRQAAPLPVAAPIAPKAKAAAKPAKKSKKEAAPAVLQELMEPAFDIKAAVAAKSRKPRAKKV